MTSRRAAEASPEVLRSRDEIRRRLLAYYDCHRRSLPWRRDFHPYHVWVSEIMLQQTRVATAIPYYERWLKRFPTLDDLARADREEVLGAWAGLGYYSRARNLHRAAMVVREHHGGEIPDSAGALRQLPGIGDYTAGAIASIAFGRPEAAIDSNARRVLSRLFDLNRPTNAALGRMAAELVPTSRPGDFNQALMELGARVCTPRSPDCGKCPLRGLCRARERGTQEMRPEPRAAARAIPRFVIGTAVLVSAAGRLLLARRPESGLLAGMWEFPGVVAGPREEPLTAARRAFRAALGPARQVISVRAACTFTHAYSHRRHEYNAFRFETAGEPPPQCAPSGRRAGRVERRPAWTAALWTDPTAIEAHPLPAAQRRIARVVLRDSAGRAGWTS